MNIIITQSVLSIEASIQTIKKIFEYLLISNADSNSLGFNFFQDLAFDIAWIRCLGYFFQFWLVTSIIVKFINY